MSVPRGGAAPDAVELLLEQLQRLVEFLWSRFVETAQSAVDRSGGAFELVHHSLGGFQLTLKFLQRGLVTGGGRFCNLLLQTAGVLLELR